MLITDERFSIFVLSIIKKETIMSISTHINTDPEIGSIVRFMDENGKYEHCEVIEIVEDRLLVRPVDYDEHALCRTESSSYDFYSEIGPHWEILIRGEWFAMDID